MTDEQLALTYRRTGDRTYLDALAARYLDPIRRYASLHLPPAEAERVTTETLAAVDRWLSGRRPMAGIRGELYRTVRRLIQQVAA